MPLGSTAPCGSNRVHDGRAGHLARSRRCSSKASQASGSNSRLHLRPVDHFTGRGSRFSLSVAQRYLNASGLCRVNGKRQSQPQPLGEIGGCPPFPDHSGIPATRHVSSRAPCRRAAVSGGGQAWLPRGDPRSRPLGPVRQRMDFSGSSVLTPSSRGIRSGRAPVAAMRRASSAWSSFNFGWAAGSSMRFRVSCGSSLR